MPLKRINPYRRDPKPDKFEGFAIPKPGKRKKAEPRAKTPEAVIQAQVESYIAIRGLAHFHIPDALLRAGFSHGAAVNGALINAAAAVRGFPDLLVFHPDHYGKHLALELKTSVGTMTQNQRDWQWVLGTKLARSFDEAKEQIDEWVNQL